MSARHSQDAGRPPGAPFDPAFYERITPISRDVLAAMERLPCIQHVYRGSDPTAACVNTISVWDSEEHARFSPEALREPPRRLLAFKVWCAWLQIFPILDGQGAATKQALTRR